MTQDLIWGLALVLLAVLLAGMEFMLPTGGLLGTGAVVCAVAGIVLGFQDGVGAGLTVVVTLTLLLPTAMLVAVRVWPYTPIGRRMLNLPPELTPTDAPVDERLAALNALVGQVGIAKTDLLPSGLAEIAGRRYDVVARGTAVDAGQFVEVCSIEAGKIRVRPTSRRPGESESESADRDEAAALAEIDALPEKTLDELDLEDLGDPLA